MNRHEGGFSKLCKVWMVLLFLLSLTLVVLTSLHMIYDKHTPDHEPQTTSAAHGKGDEPPVQPNVEQTAGVPVPAPGSTTTSPADAAITTAGSGKVKPANAPLSNILDCEPGLDTRCEEVQEEILKAINDVRRAANASNMLKMTWDKEAAKQAQDWASDCVYEHGPELRTSSIFAKCGQNIAQSSGTPKWGWKEAIEGWNSEIKDFLYGKNPCRKDNGVVGHYTQDVWASTYQMGCGFAYCAESDTNYFVCNFCPGGNVGGYCKPYLEGITADGSVVNGGICGSCGGKESDTCENGLCTLPWFKLLKNP